MRTAYQVVDDYKATVQRIISCFTAKTVSVDVKQGYYPADDPHVLTVNRGLPLTLPGPAKIALAIRQLYKIEQDPNDRSSYRISTVEYIYHFQGANQDNLVGYHWHPLTTPDKPYPHLHTYILSKLLACKNCEACDVVTECEVTDHTHLRTSRVSLEELLRMAVEEFGVVPTRADWVEELALTEEEFRRLRHWS